MAKDESSASRDLEPRGRALTPKPMRMAGAYAADLRRPQFLGGGSTGDGQGTPEARQTPAHAFPALEAVPRDNGGRTTLVLPRFARSGAATPAAAPELTVDDMSVGSAELPLVPSEYSEASAEGAVLAVDETRERSGPRRVTPPPPPPAGPDAAEIAARLETGLSALRSVGERLVESMRTETVELALLLARRILDAELAAENVEALTALVRGVLRKAGESRRVVLRVMPEVATRLEAAGTAKLTAGLPFAALEIVPDATLTLGDCLVEADFGTVEARLDARLAELRRLVLATIGEGEGTP